MQPFYSATPRDALLNVIRILDNADKHMLIPVVAAAPRSFRIDVIADSSDIVPQPTFIRPIIHRTLPALYSNLPRKVVSQIIGAGGQRPTT